MIAQSIESTSLDCSPVMAISCSWLAAATKRSISCPASLIRSYDPGVNAYVVKPVNFPDFIEAVKALGGFRAVINEPPPQR